MERSSCAAGGLEVVRGGADRVDRVVGVLAAVVVGVDAVCLPARRDELHPAEGAGGGDVQVRAEGGLDAVDRGEHLPRDPVLGSAGLVDREEEGRDRELVDDEVRDADRRRAEVRDGDGGVRVGRSAVGVAILRRLDRLVRILTLILRFRVVRFAPALAAAAVSLTGLSGDLVELVAIAVLAVAVVAAVVATGRDVGVNWGIVGGGRRLGRSRRRRQGPSSPGRAGRACRRRRRPSGWSRREAGCGGRSEPSGRSMFTLPWPLPRLMPPAVAFAASDTDPEQGECYDKLKLPLHRLESLSLSTRPAAQESKSVSACTRASRTLPVRP